MIENEMTVSVPLEVVKASEIEPKEVKWLWYPYIPVGKVTLLQGDPGDGKSKLMLSIAALLSKGEPLPFTETEENEPMTIIYQTTEDDADDTVVPRFNSAGGNGENLIFIKEDEKSLSFGDNRIREAIEMCLTAFLQATILVAGLMVFKDHALLGLGLMLSAGEIPRIAGAFGLDTTTRANIMSAVYTAQTAVNMTRTVVQAVK